ncbi:cytochrome P450 [Mycena filopes]|nr:cytochrome P450 [Mycena filopes]
MSQENTGEDGRMLQNNLCPFLFGRVKTRAEPVSITSPRLRVSGVPHFLAVEDEYRGYRLPANSVVIGNIWALSHDEAMYPDPDAFKPERFLLADGTPNPDVRDPPVFGFGRRVCPGRYMATSSVWISVASILATFNITKSVDIDGKIVEPTYECSSGFLSAPLPFQCSIQPQSQESVALIQSTAGENFQI